MSIEIEPLSDAPQERTGLIRLSGFLSLRDVGELKSSLKQLLKRGICNLLIDTKDVRDMDEAGWAALVSAVRKLHRQKGCGIIYPCSDELFQQLESHHWDRDFLFPLRDEAHLAQVPTELQGYFMPGIEPKPEPLPKENKRLTKLNARRKQLKPKLAGA